MGRIIKYLDEAVNFIPSLPSRLLDVCVRGPEALAVLPLAGLGYIAGWVGQGAVVSYVMMHNGVDPYKAMAAGAITTLIPPVTKVLRIFYSR